MDATESGPSPVGPLVEEFLERRRLGERPTLEEFVARFPELEAEIRRVFPALGLLEELGPGTVGAGATTADGPVGDAGPSSERLGDFRILREIGRGGMGVVYEAEQGSLGRRVALKVLPPGRLAGEEPLRRFEREAQAAARLHHTNIVPVFGSGREQGCAYYVMQLIRGRGLDRVIEELARLRRSLGAPADGEATVAGHDPEEAPQPGAIARSMLSGRFEKADGPPGGADAADAPTPPPAESEAGAASDSVSTSTASDLHLARGVARVGIQVAEALAYAHRQGVLHRDIKPSNLLLDEAGDVWVADFGLAKLAEGDDLTHTGEVVGTLRYMAPERFRGEGDGRSDQYSLGLTLYELLALRPAFDAPDRARLVRLVMEGDPPPLRKVAPSVPADLATIVAKAMSRRPEDRYPTAGALADDLRRWRDGSPISARPVGPLERLAKWARRNPALAASTGVAIGLAASLIAALAISNVRIRAAFGRAESALERAKVSARQAEQVIAFLTEDILGQADPEVNPVRDNLTVEEALDRAGDRIGHRFEGEPEVDAEIRYAIGRMYHQRGRNQKAEPHLRQAWETLGRAAGPEDPRTLRARLYFAVALQNLQRYEEAEGHLRELLRSPDEPRRILVIQSHLADLFWETGKLEEAEALQRRLVEGFGETDGPQAEMTLTMRLFLARVLSSRGALDEAEAILRDVVEIRRRTCEPQAPPRLGAQRQLASFLNAQGRFAEAEPILRETLEGYDQVYGPDHPHTLTTLGSLVISLWRLGRFAEAEPLSRRSCDAWMRTQGPDHPLGLSAMSVRALLMMDRGEFDRAEPLLREVLHTRERIQGPEHFDTAIAAMNLGRACRFRGQPAQAAALCRRGLETLRSKLGPDHPTTRTAADILAGCLLDAGRAPEAVAMLEGGVRERPEDPSALVRLALSLLASGDEAGYRARCAEGLGRLADPAGPDAVEVLRAGLLVSGAIDPARAVATAEAAAAREPKAAERRFLLGLALLRADRLGEAVDRLTEAADLDPTWTSVAQARAAAAIACARLGREAEALAWVARASDRRGDPARRIPAGWVLTPAASWRDRLVLDRLTREAAALALDPLVPANPFAPG
ncbi:Serine/threonine-protein kinase pkn5 [Aquisphaera giovannonii]|uniref:Serine/threonine-protein kinase pkn5 n=1 Tax=Aquisphaera giovannonii TaxID=406548 RepID=A0A5B9VZA1_9BACT|nr:serine/threonine-protein kinase [Aquisphaera giovannonii]QEH33000.1 Serine/threonine-protein kinase pkn5 [Aquisphaera giovannonii]